MATAINRVVENAFFWGVVIDDGDGNERFALNGDGGRWLGATKELADKFCKQLRDHLKNRCRVVRIRAHLQED